MAKEEFVWGLANKEIDLERLHNPKPPRQKLYKKPYIIIAGLSSIILYSMSLLYIFDRMRFNGVVGAVIGGASQNAAAGDPKALAISLVFLLTAMLLTRILFVDLLSGQNT